MAKPTPEQIKRANDRATRALREKQLCERMLKWDRIVSRIMRKKGFFTITGR